MATLAIRQRTAAAADSSAGSGQQRAEKGVSESDREWYSGGDLRGSSGENLSSGGSAVRHSEGGLMAGTGGVCGGHTTMTGSSSSSLSGGTGEVQRMWSDSSGSARTGGVQRMRYDESTGRVQMMRDGEGMACVGCTFTMTVCSPRDI